MLDEFLEKEEIALQVLVSSILHEKEIERINTLLDKSSRKLANNDFVKKAPEEVIEKEKEKNSDYRERLDKLSKNLEGIIGW